MTATLRAFAIALLGAAAVSCGGSGEGSPPDIPTAITNVDLPTSIPIGSPPPIDFQGELLLYRSTLYADAVATTIDKSRAWSFEYDANKDSVISVECTRDGGRAAYLMAGNASLDNRLIIADGSTRREIDLEGEVIGAAWAPDGATIAYSVYLPDLRSARLSLLDRETGTATHLLTRTGTIGAPRWSPDGTRIVLDASVDRGNQLFVYTLAGGSVAQITDLGDNAFGPDWSPDGSTIVFASYVQGNPQLFTVPAASGGVAAQLTTTQVFKANPRWSADGSLIAYVGTILVPTVSRLRSGGAPVWAARLHNVGVYTSGADGSNELLITDLTQDAWLLGWCAAGQWLA